MDEMIMDTAFAKAMISTVISNVLKSKGIDVDISFSSLEIKRDDSTKETKIKTKLDLDGVITDEQIRKLAGC